MDHTAKLGSWGELYVMLGTSSAALIGLLFVAASLHLREIVNNAIYKVRAQNSTLLLVGTLVQSAAILTPQPLWMAGIELLIINVWSIWIPVSLLYKAARTGRRGGFSPYRAAFFIAGSAIGIVGSLALIAQKDWGLYPVTVGYISCLIATIWNAWNIMLGIGQTQMKRAR